MKGKIASIGEHEETRTPKLSSPESSVEDGVLSRAPQQIQNSNTNFVVNTMVSFLVAITALLVGANSISSLRNEIQNLEIQVANLEAFLSQSLIDVVQSPTKDVLNGGESFQEDVDTSTSSN
jgi:hypothetical protein